MLKVIGNYGELYCPESMLYILDNGHEDNGVVEVLEVHIHPDYQNREDMQTMLGEIDDVIRRHMEVRQ